jgi:hypothetical protein
VLKTRLTIALLCVLYVVAACCFGLLHNHRDSNAHQHCAACAWLVNAVTDAPAAVTQVPVAWLESSAPVRASLVFVAAFFLPTSSRAPPVASA